ncbi:ArdC-like ssDNA-binding domain-containing protein [Methylobacterium durans]|uniref:N-terminal domain-containing protein n=1 Tax=Methylobacterium durans TaxID=2202825 RepID=A0A2U8W827_9HYPH|nr:ArdC-like ssDNA-binding domain-containing protein [Methylobacterium durans]AWN42277.1 hypothetical protein DK389_19480 [Methylobacterium durans]
MDHYLWNGARANWFSDSSWATNKHWGELSAYVRRGERSTLVVIFTEFGEESEDDKLGCVAKASYAFNAAQVESVPEVG